MSIDALEYRIGPLLHDRKLTLSVAESCTGGLIMHRITNVPGSSVYLLGGLVVYSYESKVQFAGVAQASLDRYGAVSEQVAAEMARGVCAAFGTDLALSVTGIAGPTGGTPEKPVGLTYIGLTTSAGTQVIRRVWELDREGNKALSAEAALELLYAYLTKS